MWCSPFSLPGWLSLSGCSGNGRRTGGICSGGINSFTYEWGMDPPGTIMLVVIVLIIAWLFAHSVKMLRAKIGR